MATGAAIPAEDSSEFERALLHARGLLQRGDAAAGFAACKRLYDQAPKHPHVLELMGLAWQAVGQPSVAAGFLDRAVAADRSNPSMKATLAALLRSQGQMERAADLLMQALELAPLQRQWRAQAMSLCEGMGRLDDAEFHADLLIAERCSDELRRRALEFKALRLYDRGYTQDAMNFLDEASALDATVRKRIQIGSADASGRRRDWSEESQVSWSSEVPPEQRTTLLRESELAIIDDAIADPMAYRAQALNACEREATFQSDANFPGIQTIGSAWQPLMDRMAHALGRSIRWRSPDNGAFRISREGDRARADIHVDIEAPGDAFAGVLFLTLPEFARGGTSFWRHRATGWHRLPVATELQAAGYTSFREFRRRWLPNTQSLAFDRWVARREAAWDLLFEVPMRFNRLIVYRADWFHGISSIFGRDLANARLTQLFYFEADPAG